MTTSEGISQEDLALMHWLRRQEVPAKLKLELPSGESQEVIVAGRSTRGRWESLIETIHATGATVVHCLNKSGGILRSRELEPDAETIELEQSKVLDPETRRVQAWQRETAMILREQGIAIKEAYKEGANAANGAQQSLVASVEVMTKHWAAALTSIHNLANAMAMLIQQHAEERAHDKEESAGLHDQNGKMIEGMMGMMAAKALGLGADEKPTSANGQANGGKKK